MATRALIFDDQFVYDCPDGLFGTEPFALFLTRLSRCFPHTTLLARPALSASLPRFSLPAMRYVALPRYRDVATLCLFFPRYAAGVLRQLKRAMHDVDVLFLHWPHPISLLAVLLARTSGRRRPIGMFARTDAASLVQHRYTGARRVLARAAVWLLEGILPLVQQDVIVFAAGSQVYARYRRRICRTYSVVFEYLPRTDVAPLSPTRARARDAPFTVLYVGRLEPEKGVATLVHAVRHVVDAGDVPIRCEIVGSGSQESVLRSMAETSGVTQQLRFHGQVEFGEPLFARYRAADLLVLPSCTEGIPHVLLEAMWFGVPVATTAVGAMAALIRSGENGWLVEPGSSVALADTIRAAARAPELRTAVARAARLDVEELLRTQPTVTIREAVEAWPGRRAS